MVHKQSKDPFSSEFSSFVNVTIERIFLRSWWLVLFFLICYISYDKALVPWRKQHSELEQKMQDLKAAKRMAIRKQEHLLQEISSQNDPAWVELILMKGLGVAPKGHLKVFFDQAVNE